MLKERGTTRRDAASLRRRCVTIGALLVALGSARAEAAPTKTALRCEAQSRDAQVAREKHAYLSARSLLASCASAECPALIQKDCSRWLDEVDAATPSVVLEVRGVAAASARVSVDGKPVDRALAGAKIALDPGAHRFVVQAEGREKLDTEMIVFEGEKLRKLVFELVEVPLPRSPPPPPLRPAPPREGDRIGPPPPAAPAPGLGAPFWVLTSVAAAGLATGASLFYVGGVQREFLADRCRSLAGCTEGDKDALRTRLLVADVAVGVGLASAVAATVVYLVRRSASSR